MTIAQAFNDIAIAQGGNQSTSGSITDAIDALNDALAGSDQASAQTIEQAVRLLGENIGGGGGATVGSLHMLPMFYAGTIADGESLEGEPKPATLLTLMIGNSLLIDPNLGEWSQSAGNVQVAEGVKIVISDDSDGSMDGIYAMTPDMQTGKMTGVRKVDCGEDFIEYDNLSCVALNMPQMSDGEFLLIHNPAGE